MHQLGAGTAVPTACLLWTLLRQSRQLNHPLEILLTVADYNPQVLALATIPNLLLSVTVQPEDKDEGDLDLSPAVVSNFKGLLDKSHISVSAVSGAWGPTFVDLVLAADIDLNGEPVRLGTSNSSFTLVVASETIYSPESLRDFTQTVLSLLSTSKDRSASQSLALIAAKRVYFGVGGGVDEFITVLEELGGWGKCVWDSSGVEGESKGVERCILEVGIREA
jgi:protein-histidine N-methyltransferase